MKGGIKQYFGVQNTTSLKERMLNRAKKLSMILAKPQWVVIVDNDLNVGVWIQ